VFLERGDGGLAKRVDSPSDAFLFNLRVGSGYGAVEVVLEAAVVGGGADEPEILPREVEEVR
jgi:hypothetical protein